VDFKKEKKEKIGMLGQKESDEAPRIDTTATGVSVSSIVTDHSAGTPQGTPVTAFWPWKAICARLNLQRTDCQILPKIK
jgi:hypothetical protein